MSRRYLIDDVSKSTTLQMLEKCLIFLYLYSFARYQGRHKKLAELCVAVQMVINIGSGFWYCELIKSYLREANFLFEHWQEHEAGKVNCRGSRICHTNHQFNRTS